MELCIAVLFESEARAFEGLATLRRMAGEGPFEVSDAAVIRRDDTAGLCVARSRSGLVLRAACALAERFFEGMTPEPEANMVLAPGSAALVAEIVELDSSTLDTAMGALGGCIRRRSKGSGRSELLALGNGD